MNGNNLVRQRSVGGMSDGNREDDTREDDARENDDAKGMRSDSWDEESDLRSFLNESIERSREIGRTQTKLRRKASFYRFFSLIAVIVGLVIVGYPMVFQTYNAYKFARLVEESNQKAAQWPYPHAEVALQEAREYNVRLYESSFHNIGEVNDPYSEQEHGSDLMDAFRDLVGNDADAPEKGKTTSELDDEYMSTLDQGDGIIGSIEIPKISVTMPIYHGTSSKTLNAGAGHLYGTGFPVNQVNSHTVITAHRGLPTALFFTRLGEMELGDEMYVTTMGKTFGYLVDRIEVIEPTDISKIATVAGEERLTLMTCTPYGVNTHRLLVSGLRGNIPQPVPSIPEARNDLLWVMVSVLLTMLSSLICYAIARRRRHAMWLMRARHATWQLWW